MKGILFTLLIVISISTYAQKGVCNNHIPYFKTLNVKTLSRSLTQKLGNDSAKVYAIHCWITHHIKYDVKKMNTFNYKKVRVKRILWRRKAVCTGYSDLLNELCKQAGIVSTEVVGYSKNMHTDLNDKFYFDDHSWNAVYINGEWKLIDACWDAGYINPYRRTAYGYVIYFISKGKRDNVKFKSKFIFRPTTYYYCKSGEKFIINHIPSNPIWQLNEDEKSVSTVEKDSAFFLGKKNENDVSSIFVEYNYERLRVAKMTQVEKDIYTGPIVNKYNIKNHYPLAIRFATQANELYNDFDFTTKDSIAVVKVCDSIAGKLSNSLLNFDSAIVYLNQQKAELKINNLKKNTIFRSQNKRLMVSTNNSLNHLATGNKIAKRGKKNCIKIVKLNTKNTRNLQRNTSFEKAQLLKKYRSIDSAQAVLRIAILKDSLLSANTAIALQYNILNKLYEVYHKKRVKYSYGTIANEKITNNVTNYRMNYSDDLDYKVRELKDTLLSFKFKNDSLLIDTNGMFIYKSFLNLTKSLKKKYNTLYRYHKSISSEYTKLKKFKTNIEVLKPLYDLNIKAFNNTLNNYKNNLTPLRKQFTEIKRDCKKQKKLTVTELFGYLNESRIESILFKKRTLYITRYHKSLVNLCKTNNKIYKKQKRQILKVQKKFTRKVK